MSGSGVAREMTRNQQVRAALNNEALTRQRVDKLELRVSPLEVASKYHAEWLTELDTLRLDMRRRGFWGRLRWLLTGR